MVACGAASQYPQQAEPEHDPQRVVADERKRELRKALSEAFSTPLEPEDILELSRGLDAILNDAKNIVGEAEAMQTEPAPPRSPAGDRAGPGRADRDTEDQAVARSRPRRCK